MSILNEFVPITRWVESQGGYVFPTKSSTEWFIRTHKDELIESGVLILRRGSGGSLIGPRFGEVSIAIMQRESRQYMERVA